jgi:protein SCO1
MSREFRIANVGLRVVLSRSGAFRFVRALTIVLVLGVMGVAGDVFAQPAPAGIQDNAGVAGGGGATDRVGMKEHLNALVPLETSFLDESSTEVRLSSLFTNKRPKVLVFAYHSCPQVCSMVLKAVTTGLSSVAWSVNQQFDVIVVSFDPKDTTDASVRKRAAMVAGYGRAGADAGFHFLTGTKENIDKLTAAVGYEYDYVPETGQFGHPAAITLLAPSGAIARYLYGLEFSANDLRIGLLEASEGRSISTFDQVILNCYTYDRKQQKYVLVAWRVMRIGGALVALVFGVVLAFLWRRESHRKRKSTALTPPLEPRST